MVGVQGSNAFVQALVGVLDGFAALPRGVADNVEFSLDFLYLQGAVRGDAEPTAKDEERPFDNLGQSAFS